MDEPVRTEPAHEEPTAPAESERPRPRRLPVWIGRPLRWGWTGLRKFVKGLMILWATLALYWSNLPWWWARVVMAIGFASFSVWALWVKPSRRPRMGFAAAFISVVMWFICIPPSHDRPWRPDASVLPHAQFLDDDHVRITGFRSFDYFPGTGSRMPRTGRPPRVVWDFKEHWETRDVHISHIVSMDWFISYWKIGPVAHTFVSFNCDDGRPPVCISIEARPEIDEGFEPLASNFKQFELIYIIGDERDIVRVRTNYRDEHMFMYPIRATPQNVRDLFRIYLKRVNEIYERPEWYHLLSNNCTLNILRYGRTAGVWGDRFDHRHLFNGLVDRYLFGAGVIDTDLSFDELRERSHINEAAIAADNSPDFSAKIRASLPPPSGNGINSFGQ
jgi:hypothetical protein